MEGFTLQNALCSERETGGDIRAANPGEEAARGWGRPARGEARGGGRSVARRRGRWRRGCPCGVRGTQAAGLLFLRNPRAACAARGPGGRGARGPGCSGEHARRGAEGGDEDGGWRPRVFCPLVFSPPWCKTPCFLILRFGAPDLLANR